MQRVVASEVDADSFFNFFKTINSGLHPTFSSAGGAVSSPGPEAFEACGKAAPHGKGILHMPKKCCGTIELYGRNDRLNYPGFFAN